MPIDLILGGVIGEEEHYDSYDEYVRQLQHRMRESHQVAREQLDAAAERRKNEYDVRARTSQFKVGQSVWYFYPRRYTKRSPKWSRNYDGPFLITKEIPPSDYVIQRSKRSESQVVHGDKLKLCYGETPTSWLRAHETSVESTDAEVPPLRRPVECKRHNRQIDRQTNGDRSVTDKQPTRRQLWTIEEEGDSNTEPRPERMRRLPSRFRDYSM